MLRAIRNWLNRFLTSQDGPTAVEYAVSTALIVAVCLASISLLGGKTIPSFGLTGKALISSGKSGST